ncbi:MAG: PrsW family intramembrane metalloprotease [Prevotella sp.]|nr:PrsW family intramembrane metalloprotease [Prevotella sp.]
MGIDVIIKTIAALLPAILLWLYIWKKDPQPEPTPRLVKAVLLGVAVCIPVSLLELGIQNTLFGLEDMPSGISATTVQAFLVAALPEEAFKLLALWWVLRRNPFFDEHFDGIVYAVCVGLGFAAIENVFYLYAEEEWVAVAFTRAFLAVPAHYAFAIMMGYYYSTYHFVNHSRKTAACILLVPVAAHGIYDALALTGLVNPYVGGVGAIVLVFFCVRMHRVAKEKILALLENDGNGPSTT